VGKDGGGESGFRRKRTRVGNEGFTGFALQFPRSEEAKAGKRTGGGVQGKQLYLFGPKMGLVGRRGGEIRCSLGSNIFHGKAVLGFGSC